MELALESLYSNLKKTSQQLKSLSTELKLRYEREYYRNNFIPFCVDVLGYKDVTADIHLEIGEKLTHSFERGLIMIPRKHLKTCLISIGWIIWMWVRNPNLRVGLGSATGNLAEDIISEMQAQISENPKFVELYGDWSKSQRKGKKLSWTKSQFNIGPRTKVSKDKSMTVFSVGADPTGQHYDITLLDDLANRKNSESQLQRDKQIKLYLDCLDLIVDDEKKCFLDKEQEKGIILLVGTRWHFGDVYNYLMTKNRTGLDFIIDEPCMKNDTLRNEDKEGWRRKIKLLFEHPDTRMLVPNKFDLKWAKQTYRDKGTYEFSCQQMNFPTSDETSAFKAEDLVFIPPELVPGNLVKYLLVDPAGLDSTYERADDWALVTIGVQEMQPVPRLFILGAVAKSKISINDFLKLIELEDAKHQPYLIAMEKTTVQTNAHILKTAYPYMRKKIRSIKPGNQRSKTLRILGLQPYVENNHFIIVEDPGEAEKPFGGKLYQLSEGKSKLIDQFVDFGNAEHDDLADACANILEIIRPQSSGREGDKPYVWKPRNRRTGY